MPCEELNRLREQAKLIRVQVAEQRRKAREKALDPRYGRGSGKSEMVPFLERKLQRLAERIQFHTTNHNCQD